MVIARILSLTIFHLLLFPLVRSGSKLIVRNPARDLVLLEDRLQLTGANVTFQLQGNSPRRGRLLRNSSFFMNVEVKQVNFVPKYNDYNAWNSNENDEFIHVRGFQEVTSKHCRYPAPNHYTINHELKQDRQTKVYPATCYQQSRDLCPRDVSPGETYYYRSLNDKCNTAEEPAQNINQSFVKLQQDSSKLYCTNYTNFVTDIFGIKEYEFVDNPLQSFPTVNCTAAYQKCRICRDTCSYCDKSNNMGISGSCSCCFKNCLVDCKPFYDWANCTRIPKHCAKGDTSQFTLAMNKSSNLFLNFNCFLEYDFPKTLYTLRYKVQHRTGRFSSKWISETLKAPQKDDDPFTKIQRGKTRLGPFEVVHSTNFNISPLFYLRVQRVSNKDPYQYSISNLVGENTILSNASGTKTVKIQTKTPFSITTRSWSKGENCGKLSVWSETFRNIYHDLQRVNVENLGVQAGGGISYHIQDPQQLPMMTVSISEDESIFKYVLTKSDIRNDETFQSSISQTNSTWKIKISGTLTSCPGFFTLQVINEIDDHIVLGQDVVILCPETNFKVELHIPRKNLLAKEVLFSVFLSDSKQKLKFQLAVVDKGSRKSKEPVKKYDDENPNPWITLMPVFVVTGCVLLCLFGLMIYAQVTHKPVVNKPSRWTFKTRKSTKICQPGKTKNQPKHGHRLKRRHLILVVFFVVVRIVYSLVFTFSMAFAMLTILHGPNLKTIQGYQDFVQSKIHESDTIATRMDQHREREVKRILDVSGGIQRSCDFFLGIQLQWLRYNISCIIQENQLKIFNKLSKKIVEKVTKKVEELKMATKKRIKVFEARTKRKIKDTEDHLTDYGRRVYDNKWFLLAKGAYQFKGKSRRKKREIAANKRDVLLKHDLLDREISRGLHWHATSTRGKRSIGDNSFIGFLDFLGVVDQDRMNEIENNIKYKVQFAKDGLADFSEVLSTGKSPEHPLTMILMCPLRFMIKTAKEQMDQRIREIEEKGKELAKSKAECIVGNFSDFFAANSSTFAYILSKADFSERIMFEQGDGFNGTENLSQASKSSLIESVRGGSFFNIEEGDIMEEEIDKQKKEFLQREGKIKNTTSLYEADVFIAVKKAVLGVVYVIDILLLIYRGSKTFQFVLRLIQGFEEIVEHDEDEFQEKPSTTKERAERLVRQVLDILAKGFSRFLTFCKTLHEKIMRTNIIPMCIIIAASVSVIYLLIVLVFNVMNVTVIEELGGYDLMASRLDTDYNFTNLAIADQVDFINNNEMQLYKETVNKTISEYNAMIVSFNIEQQEHIERLKKQLCSLDEDASRCLNELQALTASLLNFNIDACVIPTLEGTLFEDYDGEAYREGLKQGSKRFVDAVRNIVLETIYFTLGVVLLIIIIAFLSFVVFLFLKSRGMVRVIKIHVYKSLPDGALPPADSKTV